MTHRPTVYIAGIWFAMMLWLFFPGYMSTDSYNQLMMARGRVAYTDAQSFVLTRVLALLDAVIPGPFLMLVLQLAVFAAGLYFLLKAFTASRLVHAIAFTIIAFHPAVFSILGIIWKDVWTASALIWAAYFLSRFMFGEQQASTRSLLFGVSLLSAAALCRLNAMGASLAVATLTAFFILWLGNRPMRIRLAQSLFVLVGVPALYVALTALLTVGITVKKINFDTVTMGFDLAGMSVAANKRLIDKGYQQFISDEVTIEQLKVRFTPRYHACLYRPCKGQPSLLTPPGLQSDLDRLRQNWRRAIADHPLIWLQHRAKVAVEILQINHPDVWAPIFREPYVGSATKLGEVWDTEQRRETRLAIIEYSDYTHRQYFYLILSAVVALLTLTALIFWKRKRQQFFAVLTIVTAGVAYQTTILVAATSADYRYSHPMVLFSIVSALLFLITVFSRRPAD